MRRPWGAPPPGSSGRPARSSDAARGVRRRPGRSRWRPVARYTVGPLLGPSAVVPPVPAVRVDGGRFRTSSPPTPSGPCLCPPPRRGCTRVPIRSPGRRSARGYPAAVSTPVGADPTVVGPYLAAALGDERWRSVTIELIAAGMSNLTYVVTPADGGPDDAVILRRPPTGAVLATAHDMAREHTVVSALGPTAVPVPRTLHLCEDPAVLGAPFYVMERVVGVHVVD